MRSIIFKCLVVIAISTTLFSCKNDENIIPVNPLEGLIKLKEGYALGASAKVEIWGKKNFFAGYNNLVIVLLDSTNTKDTLKDAHIHFAPLMTMGMGTTAMQHACPIENPDEAAINGVFPGALAFVMPTSTDGNWKLGVTIHNHKNDKEGQASFDITVDNPTPSVLSVFTASTADATKLVLSLVQPLAPKVGMNDIEFTLHSKASMMEWPAETGYTIEITPEMPSMEHGSPNNVNPVHVANGHYKGKVNFTMTGEWKVNIVLKKNGVPVKSDAFFNITF